MNPISIVIVLFFIHAFDYSISYIVLLEFFQAISVKTNDTHTDFPVVQLIGLYQLQPLANHA